MQLELAKIRIDGGTQSRVELSEETIKDYTDVVVSGHAFPPVMIFFDGVDHWLADGFHRFHAHRAAGAVHIEASINTGTKRDAVLYSVSANGAHGMRRTNADKRKCVQMLLSDPDWCRWPEVQIAKQCHVSRDLVRSVIAEFTKSHPAEKQDTKREVTRNGKTYTQDISGIKAKAAERKVEAKQIEEPDPVDDSSVIVKELAEEVTTLREQLAVAHIAGTDEDRQAAADLITQLKQDITTLQAERDAIASSRDAAMRDVVELKKQVNYWKRRAEKNEPQAA
jgi:hypothetical protein